MRRDLRAEHRLARIAALITSPLEGARPDLFKQEVFYSATNYELFNRPDLSPYAVTPEWPKMRRGFCSWSLQPLKLLDLDSLDQLAVAAGLAVCPSDTVVVKRAFRRNRVRYAFALISDTHAHVFVLRFFGAAVEALLP